VPVKTEAGKVTESVRLINWHKPERNDFARAEEVTLGTPPVQPSKSGRLLRNTVELRHLPDFVLYQF
jgi:hypothetical protein